MTITFFTTPAGDEMAILPRAELEALSAGAEHDRAVADYRSGAMPGLTADEVREMLAAPTPLAFWRKRAGMTQGALATAVGVTQNYLSGVENGKRAGPVDLWMKLSRALSLPLEVILGDDEDDGEA